MSDHVATAENRDQRRHSLLLLTQAQLGQVSLATTDCYLGHVGPRELGEAVRAREWSR